jgi:hypothetical protein
MTIHEFKNPLPLIIKETGAEAMAIYVTSSGSFENDILTVVLCDGGDIIHVRTDQVKMFNNKTFDITK